MQYQTGEIQNPQPDDPTHDSFTAARNEAIRGSITQPMGLWTGQQDGSVLLEIWWEQDRYRKV